MVVEAIVDNVTEIVIVVGLPLLVILFYFEGLIIGKVLQPPAVFVTVIAIAKPSWPMIALLCAGSTLSVVLGQWTTYRSFDESAPEVLGLRRRLPALAHLPQRALDRVGEKRLALIDRIFDRYGGIGIFLTTFLPGIRGLLAIPAGMSAYPTRRFLAVSVIANALYFPLLVAVAFGVLRLLQVL